MDRPQDDRSDRHRLEQVHTTELTESRINEGFVDWLKTSGVTWLCVILLALAAWLFWIQRGERADNRRAEAWEALATAELPESLVDVAEMYPTIDGVATLALLRAADMRMQALQAGVPVTSLGMLEMEAFAAPGTPSALPDLTDEERTQYLAQADTLYRRVMDQDDGEMSFTLHAINAQMGLGSVAEARGDAAAARQAFERAAVRAGDHYPVLAKLAEMRGRNTESSSQPITFRPRAEITAQQPPLPQRRSVAIDPALERLINEDADE